jgi:hypothetical protein
MSKEILDPSIPNDGNTVDLGGGQLVSMKAVQQIYSEITGRTESLERAHKTNHSISFDDLCQLDAKITQLYEQYNIVTRNHSVTLFHLDDQKQTFSSFERFKLFDRTTLSPVENVRIEYNFLIVLPQMRKPQSYEIEVNIHSRAAMMKRANGDVGLRNTMFYEFLSPNTAHMEIKYVDYTVARNFQGAIDGWFKALPEQETGWLLKPLKKLTGYYIFAFRLLLVTAFLVTCYVHFSAALAQLVSSQTALFQAAAITFGGMLLMSIVSGKIGSVAAESVKRIQCISYVNLTRGDEIAFKGMSESNRLSWLKLIGSVVVAVGVKVFAEYLVAMIGITR